jgi:hypothetical protein
MKLATFEQDGRPRLGAVIDGDGKIVDLDAAFLRRHGRAEPALASMLALIDAGSAGRAVADALVADPPEEDVVAAATVRLLAPLPVPRQIRDFLCFEEHLRNAFEQAGRLTGRTFEIPPVWYEQPIYYKANRFSVVGPDADVRWPAFSATEASRKRSATGGGASAGNSRGESSGQTITTRSGSLDWLSPSP